MASLGFGSGPCGIRILDIPAHLGFGVDANDYNDNDDETKGSSIHDVTSHPNHMAVAVELSSAEHPSKTGLGPFTPEPSPSLPVRRLDWELDPLHDFDFTYIHITAPHTVHHPVENLSIPASRGPSRSGTTRLIPVLYTTTDPLFRPYRYRCHYHMPSKAYHQYPHAMQRFALPYD
uniref:Uncharacterized protein n=1 Tax=Moniliophthora roreri TaxID=221103 RepID=A0A0W0FZY5_MONRR